MQSIRQPAIMDCLWQNIRDKLNAINPLLTNHIDMCQPGTEDRFRVVRLPYGAYFMQNGKLAPQVFADSTPSLQADECLAIVTAGSFECLHQFPERIAPMQYCLPGEVLGLHTYKLLTAPYGIPQSFQVTAGARSVFMLPKITDSASHKNLQREFNIRQSTPKRLIHQWDIFRQITQATHSSSPWEAECIILPNTLLDPNNPDGKPLQLYLMQIANQHNLHWRHQYLWDLTFSRIKAQRNLKPNPYLADTCKHLFAIGVGALPGFTAAVDDTLCPTSLLQRVYCDIYGLKNYAPIIIQPSRYQQQQPVYYSLQLPTLLEFSPKSRNLSSTISDLREVKHILSTYISEFKKSELGIEDTPISRFACRTQFSYFHSEQDKYGEIQDSKQMFDEDKSLNQLQQKFTYQGFSENSPFVRGCIRLQPLAPTIPE